MDSQKSAHLSRTPASIHVEAMPDHLQSLARGKPVNALAELIWNALDADADVINILVEDNELGTPIEICIKDNGTGIPLAQARQAFGNLGGSWKKLSTHSVKTQKKLHGRDGKGRFKAFALGNTVSWETVCAISGENLSYQILGRAHDLSNFTIAEPNPSPSSTTGTTVTISSIDEPSGIFSQDGSAQQQLSEQFAIYLRDYPATQISFRGERVDPASVQKTSTSVPLAPFRTSNNQLVEGVLDIIEWNFAKKDRKLCLCDASGFMRHEVEAGIRPGADFNFTAYLKSDYIAKLNDENVLALDELNPDLARFIDDARLKLRGYFRTRKAETARELVTEWKKQGIYPYQGEPVDAIDRARREVFDICAISVNDYLDSFKVGTTKDRKFTLRMIRTAVDENPDALKKILGEILDLPKDKQNELAELLDHTSLSSIIEASKTVANRLDLIAGIQELVFNPDLKKRVKERRHLHKVLERETWLFGEEYLLTNSDENLNTVLAKHLHKLTSVSAKRHREKPHPVTRDDGSEGVLDLLLARELPQYGVTRKEYLVIELKRPSQKIDLTAKAQIESYALAVMRDERFDTKNTFWTFIAISTDITEDAAETIRQTDKPIGYFLTGTNYKVGLCTWAEVLQGSRTRLEMFRNKLDYVATKDRGVALLHDRYEKYLPKSLSDPQSSA
jgi:hypothetical protein